MRFSLENLVLISTLILTEAWFLNGYFSNQLEYEPAIAFLVALGAIFTKDRIKKTLGFDDEISDHDLQLFEEFQHTLPVEPTIRLLGETDFGNSFPRAHIQPLFHFVETWDSVEKEFINKKLEKEKKSLFTEAKELASEFAKHTVPVGRGDFASVLPDSLRGDPRPEHVLASAKVLNEKSSKFIPTYESFIRRCKAVLKS